MGENHTNKETIQKDSFEMAQEIVQKWIALCCVCRAC